MLEEHRKCVAYAALPVEERMEIDAPQPTEEEVRLPFEVWSCFRYA